MKKMYKLFIILIMFIFIFSISNNYIYATAFHDTGDGFEEDEEEVVEKREENMQEQQQQQKQQQQPLEKDENIESAIRNANDFLSIGKFLFNKEYSTSDIQQNQQAMFNILLIVGTFLAVAVGGVLGIKLMMAGAEEKAKIKEAFTPYILGCVVIFGAFGIWKVTVDVGNSLTNLPDLKDRQLQEVRQNNHDIIEQINNGDIQVSDCSDDELKTLYRGNGIDTDLKQKRYGRLINLYTEAELNEKFAMYESYRRRYTDDEIDEKIRDGTIDNALKPKMSLEDAIASLTSPKDKIYNECKKRHLLKDNGIDLK